MRVVCNRAACIRRSINKDHPNVAWTLTNLARVTADAGIRHWRSITPIGRWISERAGAGDDRSPAPTLLLRELFTHVGISTGRKSLTDAFSAREQFFGLTIRSPRRHAQLARELGGRGHSTLSQSLAAEDVGATTCVPGQIFPERRSLIP